MGKHTHTQTRFLWNLCCCIIAFLLCIEAPQLSYAQSVDTTPPTDIVKLIFIHHSCGENWLNDENGGLGHALGENNYFVSDTNYGWGPDAIGDRTDIVNWQEWFRSSESERYLAALFSESGQNSPYTRSLADPGGENEIIMFKSCFPNSNIEGSPDDPALAGEGLTVSNAKYIYNDLLAYFQTRPDKLFVVITAPPVQDPSLADNARAFNTWLVNDWLQENHYPYPNIAVFDFYNVLTGENNHHRYNQGVIEYITDQGGNTSAYASAPDDDHPSVEGNRKATEEFIPMLNIFYHRWHEDIRSQTEVMPPIEAFSTAEAIIQGELPTLSNGLIDDFESVVAAGNAWQFYFDNATDSIIRCAIDNSVVSQGNASLKIEFDIAPESWGTCTLPYSAIQDWHSGSGIGFYLHTIQEGTNFNLLTQGGMPENRTSYSFAISAPPESISGWAYIQVAWDQLRRVSWEDDAGSPFDPSQVTGITFGFDGTAEGRNTGIIWVDNIHILGISEAEPIEAGETEESGDDSAQLPTQFETVEAEPEEQRGNAGRCCRGIAFIPLPVLGLIWLGRRVKSSN